MYDFIKKSKEIHGDKYDYSLVEYKGAHQKVKIICSEHGVFEQRASSHTSGRGCKKCFNEKTLLNKTDILKKLKDANVKLFENKYDYSLVTYKGIHQKVKIICPKHGIFEQRLDHHLNGHGCSSCSNNKKKWTNDFIKKSKDVHGDKYDYSLVEYLNNNTKVKIICKEHGIFEQSPSNHFMGKGCKKCKGLNVSSNDDFIKKSKEIHGDKYDYSLSIYINSKTKVKIICPIHGIFEQIPSNHIHKKLKQGCPFCNESKGEKEIKKILDNLNINYIPEYKLYETNKNHPLRADFYLPKYNLVIEFNGVQHYKPIKKFGGVDTYLSTILRDKRKIKLCNKNNIKIIHIKYNQINEIEMIILNNIKNFL
ncbi:MAG: hypothetical protein ACOC2W_03465 [bacterium]